MAILIMTPQPARVRRIALDLEEELVFDADSSGFAERLKVPWSLTLIDEDVAHDTLGLISAARAARQRVIFFTRKPTVKTTVEAMRAGALDVMTLPIDVERLRRCLNTPELQKPNWEHAVSRSAKNEWIGSSPVLLDAFRLAGQAAGSTMNVLITGESGTGKELLGRIIHDAGGTAGNAFLTVNCAALDDLVLATELFGGQRPTGGAVLEGQLARAGSGTVFLDEISHMSLALQARVAAALRTRSYTPIGGFESKPLGARIIAATNHDLRARVAAGHFRQDLLYEFGFEIPLLPLRRRAEDITLLASYFLDEFALLHERDVHGFDADALEALEKYDWPGNVRQLRHAVEHGVMTAHGRAITTVDLPGDVTGAREQLHDADAGSVALEAVERRHIRQIWRITNGHLSETADLLGIHRNTLRRKLEQYGITDEDARS